MAIGLALTGMSAFATAQQTPTTTLAPVVVSGTRVGTSVLDTPASADVVEGAALRARQPGINLSEGLGGVPGLQIQNRQNYAQDLQLSIRGFGARSTFGVRGVRLYVDGVPGTMPDGQGQTSNIDIASIDRVEVLRGPYSALYGNSSGGVVQIFTEDGARPPSLSGSFSAGSDRTIRYGAKASGVTGSGSAVGELDYVVSVNRMTTDGYRDHSAARKTLGNAKLGLQLDEDSRLTLVMNSVNLSAQDPLGLTREQFERDPRGVADPAIAFDTRKTVRQTQGGLVYDRDLGGGDSLRAMLYYGQRDTVQYQSIPVAVQQPATHAGGVIDLHREYGGADLRWTGRRTLAGGPLTLVGGLSYDTMEERRKGYNNYTSPTQLGVRGALRRDETNNVYNLDPYAQASWQFQPRWTLDAGLRYSTVRFDSDDDYIVAGNGDDSGGARYRKLLPVTALRYAPTQDASVYVSYGRGFETPTFNELSYRPGAQPGMNFGLAPSVSNNVEVGAKLQLPTGLLTAAVFQTSTDDEIVPDTSIGGRSTFRNAGRTRRNGAELEWRHDFASHARMQLAYSWLDARYRDSVSDVIQAGNRIPGTARHAFYAGLSWQPPEGWQAGVDARYLSKIYANDANTDAAPSYVIASVSAGYAWRVAAWRIDAYARVDNLFDRQYAGSVIVNEGNGRYYEPAPGRTWTAGVGASYSF
ncbi:TonB-dependent receptor family protein [Bordetella genomosp. 13]|uniref:TonB-dependent receptor family protein n=1 Tax=Bordetella genomosp. 13 TaxID=463040 RepID=UPI00391F4515